MIRSLTIITLFCFFWGNSSRLNAQAGDSSITYSVIKLEPCRFRLFVSNTSPDCFNAATLLLQAGYYTGFTANGADGWVVEQLSQTELLLTHANGLFPVGVTRAVDFTFFEPGSTDPVFSVLYPNLCLMQSFAADLPLEACPGACVSGTVYRECKALPYTNQIPLEGWTVQLVDAQNNVVNSAISEANGAYSICDLAPGQYTVKTVAKAGWKASLPPSGQWTLNAAAAINYTRDFGYCPPCSCDSIDMYISQEGSGTDTSTYFLTLSALDALCFNQFKIAIDTGQLIDYTVDLPGWIIERVGNTLLLTAPTFLVYPCYYPPCKFRLAGAGNHVITMSATYDNGMTPVECKKSFTYLNPPAEIPRDCCPSGTKPGPELVINGDFNVTQPPPAPGSGYTTDYGWTATGTGAGQFSVLNGVQTGNANGSSWTCIGRSGNPNTDYFMVVDGAIAANKVVWRESVTVAPSTQYSFSVWVNNIILPIYNLDDPVIQIQIIDPIAGVVAMSSPRTIPETPDSWVNICLNWTSPANPNNAYRLEIRTLSTSPGGNDFAIDNISFRACEPEPCYCGGFSNMFVRNRKGALNQPVSCSGATVNLPCESDLGYHLTGVFHCDGDSCAPEHTIHWNLAGPGVTQSGTFTDNDPFFGIHLLPNWFSQAGAYTLKMSGDCGTQTCSCEVKFQVDCPNLCPCDNQSVQAFHNNVGKGFAAAVSLKSCTACFSPLALSDCETVDWYLNSLGGTHLGTTYGKQTLCHTFSDPGNYTVVMYATRTQANGNLCADGIYTRTVSLSCSDLPDCPGSVLPNAGFSQNSGAGNLDSIPGWKGMHWGDPHENLNGRVLETGNSQDGWVVAITGDYIGGTILTMEKPLCVSKSDSGMLIVTMRTPGEPIPGASVNVGRRPPGGNNTIMLYTGNTTPAPDCQDVGCYPLAVLDGLLPFNEDAWYELQIPYNLADWAAPDSCGDQAGGIPARMAVYVSNLLSEEQQPAGPVNDAILIDHVCFRGMTVSASEAAKALPLRIFPNPNTGAFTVELPKAADAGMQFRVIDLAGRFVSAQGVQPGSTRQTVDVGGIPAGLYFLQVVSEGKILATEKFVKQ